MTMKMPLALAAAVAALSPATALAGAGPWSSPVQVVPAGTDPAAASAQAFVSPDGRSLVVSSDGIKPLMVAGNARNIFGPLIPLGPESSKSAGLEAAVGADGTLAVGWAADGVVHVSVVRSGSASASQLDVPGGGPGASGAS